MKSFEQLCEEIQAFARANPDARDALVSDAAVYGGGMDAGIAMAKLKALARFAREEHGLTLYIENRADEEIRMRERK